jgi:LIVCS family branched-chain amino acid:cation transporter
MTFALFLGAGNIIFPPSVGLAAGEQVWLAAAGFLLTGVGLPLLTVVALARVGGGLPRLTAPLGVKAGGLFAIVVYLAIGPLFATPRTAVVAFEMGMAPFSGSSDLALGLYTLVYFAAVLFLSLNPGQLVDRIGKWTVGPCWCSVARPCWCRRGLSAARPLPTKARRWCRAFCRAT